jgi:hypothetical protein
MTAGNFLNALNPGAEKSQGKNRKNEREIAIER